jgi:hypothetical protein
MTKSLWQLLQEEASTLTCDECFAIMEYYAELLARGGEDLLPEVIKHLEGCPSCRMEHRAALQRLVRLHGGAAVSAPSPSASSRRGHVKERGD